MLRPDFWNPIDRKRWLSAEKEAKKGGMHATESNSMGRYEIGGRGGHEHFYDVHRQKRYSFHRKRLHEVQVQ